MANFSMVVNEDGRRKTGLKRLCGQKQLCLV